jgi:biopolymer transport protein ExbB/TolQ
MPLSNRALSDAVSRAAERAAGAFRRDMKRGLSGLATIASVAPWLGLLITVIGVVESFPGCNGPRALCMAAIADGLGDALARSALGLGVGILSLCLYRYLQGQLDGLDMEMRNMALELANAVSASLIRSQPSANFPPVSNDTPNSSRSSSSNGRPTS